MTRQPIESTALVAPATHWHSLTIDDIFTRLSSSADGLGAAEAAEKLRSGGPNELAVAARTPWWRVLARQFVSPLIAILLVAAIVTALQQHWVDSGAIFLILCLNAALGFVQERKAESDMRALQSLSTPSCRVLRDGSERVIPGSDVVLGDIVLLESGERVPADLRLFIANALEVDESMLTGESFAATKHTGVLPKEVGDSDKANIAFSGTFVGSGRGRGIVIATGAATSLGAINALVQGPSGKTPLQLLTNSLERSVGLLVLGAVVFVFIAGIVLGNDASTMFRTAVGLAVASIPESLPIVLTVALSLGVSRMAKRNAIIRTLPAVETLGSTNVIGSDKTGTLTENRLTVERVWTTAGLLATTRRDADGRADSVLVRAMLRAGALTNEATISAEDDNEYFGDAVDAAMARIAVARGAVTEQERLAVPVGHQPYEPQLRYSQTVLVDSDGQRTLYVMGSPEALIEASVAVAAGGGDEPLDNDVIHTANEQMGRDGLRVIATGSRRVPDGEELTVPLRPPSGLTFLGMAGMTDPPREGVAEAIRQCRQAGISVMMITGDHPVTATAIAARLGLAIGTRALTGAEMADLDDHMLVARLEQTSVAARVSPQDKLRIVRTLQGAGKIVAVTGDGVNDAPALKAASIGVAMGRAGTDVAREAADIVLTDDHFATIVHAVEEGRVTFSAIRKTTYFLLSTGAAALVAVTLSVFAGTPLLFLPVQMLWMNVVTNGVQDVALAFEPAEGHELSRPPRASTEGILSRTLWFRTGITGAWMALAVLLTFIVELRLGNTEVHARTLALTMFVWLSFFQVFSARAEFKSLFELRLLANKPLLFTSLGALMLHWAATIWPFSAELLGLTPLSSWEWLLCIAVGSTVLLIVEAEKAVRRWSHRHDGSSPSFS
ncbi:HAD-IC family P-type ATPase [Cryobacterium sp. PH29-G1]|uniref:cation-translocating P-type ATPase n=1 Tax=Cryobacterium sp. PH29-G1 TaxID=3046211 RepID=UPI0024B9DDF6|nr:HAD-IC family P-type ATPase [Cryobacterium sp. PH29-G1]MDJ0349912.1 HAD-IC family P-type ATPase [Cryobacterium sp. PH29-G1]